MLELLALHKLYKNNQAKNQEYNNYLERFSGNSSGSSLLPGSQLGLLGAIIMLFIYIYVFKSAWECFGGIPVVPRIIVCLVCASFWLFYLIFRYLNILKCNR